MADQKVTALTALTALTGDETLYIVEDDDGTPVSRQITIEDFLTAIAARTELTSVFAPYAATSKVWLSAGTFVAGLGTPAQTVQNGFPVWVFDASSAENVISSASMPAHWSTYSLKIYWTNNAAGSGNVVWRHGYKTATDGNSFTAASSTGTPATVAAPVAGTLKVTTLETSIAVAAAGGLNTIIIDRVAADAGDTLANDAALLGVLLERAS